MLSKKRSNDSGRLSTLAATVREADGGLGLSFEHSLFVDVLAKRLLPATVTIPERMSALGGVDTATVVATSGLTILPRLHVRCWCRLPNRVQ
jgi:hypothetical protein